jgi:hypothetical protein
MHSRKWKCSIPCRTGDDHLSSECTGGTGKFEGFKGIGTWKSERIGPVKTGGDSYIDFTDNRMKS